MEEEPKELLKKHYKKYVKTMHDDARILLKKAEIMMKHQKGNLVHEYQKESLKDMLFYLKKYLFFPIEEDSEMFPVEKSHGNITYKIKPGEGMEKEVKEMYDMFRKIERMYQDTMFLEPVTIDIKTGKIEKVKKERLEKFVEKMEEELRKASQEKKGKKH